ncbi:MAG: hypothetical protein IPP72_06990 [Chitinophagaceae bacterium]|nr:hypothetical protein [Chitinophagaceae bacterium]
MKDQFWSEQSIELQQSEWVVYNFESISTRKYNLTLRVSAANEPAQLTIVINNKKVNVDITNTEFNEVSIGDYKLKKGRNRVKILAKSNAVKVDWIKCN